MDAQVVSSMIQQALEKLSPKEGRVASLHVHGARSLDPLLPASCLSLVAEKGIKEDPRYFNRKSRSTGQPSNRQVTLIEREQIEEHCEHFAIPVLSPGVVRSNIETAGISLQRLIGLEVAIGEAVLFVYEPRTPCYKMDRIHPGLQARMKDGRQGVLARVIRSGTVRPGDGIRCL